MFRPVDPVEPAARLDFVVIDVETACSRVSSICQIGIVGFRDGTEVLSYETLVDPRDDFHSFNTRIHGICAEHVVGQPHFGMIHAVVERYLAGRTTVAHSYFDKGALGAACRVHERRVIETTWLDSVRVAKRAWPQLASHRLNVLSRYLGIPHKHHDALSDARAARLVIIKAIDHTGIPLEGWLAPPTRQRAAPAPRAAPEGPLKGERVFILGESRDGPLAQRVAALAGRVVSSVGPTTTIVAVIGPEPFGYDVKYNMQFRKAQEFARTGQQLRILAQSEVWHLPNPPGGVAEQQ
jgi:DNA polymerase III subunit epsilon